MESKSQNYPEHPEIMGPKQAAKYLGLHLITVYRLTKKGKLPGFKVGGQWRFKKDLLDAWIVSKINNYSEQAGEIQDT